MLVNETVKKNSIKIFSVALLIAFPYALSGFAQSRKEGRLEFSHFELPIVYAKEDDGLPKKINTFGVVVEASSALDCGGVATAGTLKIKLDEKVKGLSDNYLYLVVLCFSSDEREKLLNKKVKIEATKLKKYPYKFAVLLMNSIDSHGTPFYLSSKETLRVFSQSENEK